MKYFMNTMPDDSRESILGVESQTPEFSVSSRTEILSEHNVEQGSVQKSGRIIIVSNRLPINIRYDNDGYHLERSIGGVATGLESLRQESEMLWVGWPGVVGKDDEPAIERDLEEFYGCYPVFLSERLAEQYYQGFSNRTVWPLFHSFQAYTKYSAPEWDAYKEANARFCEKLCEIIRPNDTIWIHDYHLMLLPEMLRAKLPNVSIGFFLHIPFPPYDILRLLPQHKLLMRSLLACNLVGFHTYDYARAFTSTIRRLFGYEHHIGEFAIDGRITRVEVFPMGIDAEMFAAPYQSAVVEEQLQAIHADGRKLIFSVARLDYTKGIPQSFDAIEIFLQEHSEWHGKCTFLLLIAPSRESVEQYDSLKNSIDQEVGRINGKYGSVAWSPIRYMYRSFGQDDMKALYNHADVALIIPLRDGMNLVAKEYLASRTDGTGVLILSEMTGAAKELRSALIVNPNSKEDVAEAIYSALTMSIPDQKAANEPMRMYLSKRTVQDWSKRFLQTLREAAEKSRALSVKRFDETVLVALKEDFRTHHKRLIILDYDGTLVPFAITPDRAVPDEELLTVLSRLAKQPHTHVAIVSGRSHETLERWLGDLPLTLVAEHGGMVRSKGRTTWETGTSSLNTWKAPVRVVMQLFADRIPGAFIEEKQFSLVWHYRNAEPQSASVAAQELLDALAGIAPSLGVEGIPGNKIIEMRLHGIGKGKTTRRLFGDIWASFTLCAGDDWTDEELFDVMPSHAYTIKVGHAPSKARYSVASLQTVRDILLSLSQQSSIE